MSAELVVTHAQRLRAAVAVWSAGRWRAAPHSLPELLATSTTCAGVANHLVQVLADLGADAEHRPRRVVPQLGNDLALPDQLLVMAYDLAAAAPAEPVVRAALAELLLHRVEIDGARPAADATIAVLGQPGRPQQLLALAAAQCPARAGPSG